MSNNHLMNTYSQWPVTFVGGEGAYLKDDKGDAYLDFVGGIAVNALGYKHEGLAAAIREVLDSGVLHVSNLYYNAHVLEAAKKLAALSGMEKVFFCNSGAEANEAALKLARKWGSGKNKSTIISMLDSFHGRTYAAVTATGQKKYHQHFAPLPPGFVYAHFNDLDSVKALVDERTCAVIVEPIQGEGGIVPATKEFLHGLRDLCDTHELLLIYDEVQCGMGRSGKPFAHQLYGVKPDILTTAKALAGGVPAGAMLTQGEASDVFVPGDHASTFGGNALAARAIIYMCDTLQEKAFLSRVEAMGNYLRMKLEELKVQFPNLITAVRGVGLINGIALTIPPKEVVAKCFEKKLLLASAGSNVVRFVPPLIITEKEIDAAVKILQESLSEVRS
ncbi:MAG TPA: aspartate aminotransferase family protein [Sphaerochaeta sp.]|nr:aspartate aminotransferase family protein [Sphaerochaeta sp.]